MKRCFALSLVVLALAGCRDIGLDGNLPLAEAEHKTPRPLVAEVHAPPSNHAGVILDGTRWLDTGLPVEIPARYLRQVGVGHGHPLYALRWDEPPFDRIYARVAADRWQPHDPVHGVNTGEAGQEIKH